MLVGVLYVMIGEEVNEMQFAGWFARTPIPGVEFPAWAGTCCIPKPHRCIPRSML